MVVLLLSLHILVSGSFVLKTLEISTLSFKWFLKTEIPTLCTSSLYDYLREPYKKNCPMPSSDMWSKTWPYTREAQGLCIFSKLIKRSFVVSININNKKKVFSCHYP